MKKTILLCAALTAASLQAKVTLSPMISDHMVMQQSTGAAVFGTADPNERVTIAASWSESPVTATADASGNWIAEIPTPAAGYDKHTLTITGQDGKPITVNDVLIGEVWLASGQSNMQMPLRGFDGCPTKGGYDEIAASARHADHIRFLNVPMTQSYEPKTTFEGAWSVPSPDTAPDFSATAWNYARRLNEVLDVPVGIVSAAYGGARVESWLPREILEGYADVSLRPEDVEPMTHYLRPLLMYNAMFVPIKDYTYNGIIWYQGCSNVGAHQNYADRLVTMVNHWRDQIGQGDIPFYAVEIAPYDYDSPEQDEQSPYLRLAQWDAIGRLNNADMICINDLVEPYERFNIHPGNKIAAGHRLGDLALNRTYGKKQFPDHGPRYKSHRVDGDALIVALDTNFGGICRNYDVQGFEIAGDDKVFYPADEVEFLWQTNEYKLKSAKVPQPREVRYCFHDFQIGTVYGGNYLPLVPFRSDNWEN